MTSVRYAQSDKSGRRKSGNPDEATSTEDLKFRGFSTQAQSSAIAVYSSKEDPFTAPAGSNLTIEFGGTGFTYGRQGFAAGTITSIKLNIDASAPIQVSGISAPAAQLQDWSGGLDARGAAKFLEAFLSGSDDVEGSDDDDEITTSTGDDTLSGGKGDDLLDGGDGKDVVKLSGARGDYAFSREGGGLVVVTGPDGRDRLVAIEKIEFDDTSMKLDDVLAGKSAHTVDLHDSATGLDSSIELESVGADAPTFLKFQHLYAGSSNLAMALEVPHSFIKAGSGNDAIQVTRGSNVLDGGTGSNFLVGGTGADGGTDTFFTDARGSEVVWNTVVNFHTGNAATLWGFLPDVSSWRWDGISGAAGYTGATMRADVHGTGREDASITFAGLTMEQAQGLQTATGSVGGNSYLYFHNPGV